MKATRLAADWTLPAEWRAWASAHVCAYNGQRLSAPEIDEAAEKFADYWHSLSAQKGVRLDWRATWRNWVRKAARNKRPGRDETPRPRAAPDTSHWDEHDAIIRAATHLGLDTVGVSFPDIKAALERATQRE